MYQRFKIFVPLIIAGLLTGCGDSSNSAKTTTETQKPAVAVTVSSPAFDADDALAKIKTQLDFGVRVPNTLGHKKCGDWIVEECTKAGLTVIQQTFTVPSYDAKVLNARNIIASYNPQVSKRIIMAAHWDTRPVADQDDERKEQPIPGANDAASGVAILLELAETLHADSNLLNVGIDFIFFDVEDGGSPEWVTTSTNDYGGYCMGSEYWAKNPHVPGYSAYYGVLLDMVGAKGATFYKDKISMQVAPSIVNKIWSIASEKGYSSYFLNAEGGDILDDHVPVIQHRRIPMIDIIDQKKNNGQTFFDHWHTHDDNFETIDKSTLKAVGGTLIQLIYEEGK